MTHRRRFAFGKRVASIANLCRISPLGGCRYLSDYESSTYRVLHNLRRDFVRPFTYRGDDEMSWKLYVLRPRLAPFLWYVYGLIAAEEGIES